MDAQAEKLAIRLVEAVVAKDLIKVRKALADGASADGHDTDYRSYRTPLFLAVADESEQIVKVLIDAGASPIPRKSSLYNPLYEAVKSGSIGITDLLLNAGSSINHAEGEAWNMLAVSCRRLDERMIEFLLAKGANPSLREKGGGNACYEMVDKFRLFSDRPNGAERALRLLTRMLDTGVLLDLACGEGGSMMRHAITVKAPIEVLELLHARGASLLQREGMGVDHIHAAATRANVDAIAFLVERGVPVDTYDANGRTALHHCLDAATVLALVDRGACIEFRDADGRTPLNYLLEKMSKGEGREAATALLNVGARLDSADYRGETAANILARRRLPDIDQAVAAQRARQVMRVTAVEPRIVKTLKSAQGQ